MAQADSEKDVKQQHKIAETHKKEETEQQQNSCHCDLLSRMS